MSEERNDDSDILDGDLRIRIDKTDFDTFKTKSERVTGKPYQLLLREIITAFNDGRLRIVPTEEQKQHFGELYQ